MAGGRIGLDHLAGGRVHHQHRVRRGAEQQPIAGLELAQSPIIALERLLGVDQALLQRREALQVATDRQ